MFTWLESKRSALPLFALLANSELLEILIRESDPAGLSPFLPALLGGIDKLELGAPIGWEEMWTASLSPANAGRQSNSGGGMHPQLVSGGSSGALGLAGAAVLVPSSPPPGGAGRLGGPGASLGSASSSAVPEADDSADPAGPSTLDTIAEAAEAESGAPRIAKRRPSFTQTLDIADFLRSGLLGVDEPVRPSDPPNLHRSTLLSAWAGGEELTLPQPVFLLQPIGSQRSKQHLGPKPLEVWLGELQRELKEMLLERTGEALHRYFGERASLTALVRTTQLPKQALVVASRVAWAYETEEAFKVLPEMPKAVTAYLRRFTEALADMATAAGSDQGGSLTRPKRAAMQALVLAGCWHRDVLAEVAAAGVAGPGEFVWTQHIRYEVARPSGDLLVAFPDGGALKYGYELISSGPDELGAVLTTPIERQLVAMNHAVRCGAGSLLLGPAQAGKTETVAALGRVAGRRVHVASAAGGLDVSTLGRLVRGMVRGGLWLCLDGVDKLPSALLAGLTHSIIALQSAVRQRHSAVNLDESTASTAGTFVTITPGFGIFATVTTSGDGSALKGSKVLPGRLRHLFRSCVVTPPATRVAVQALMESSGFMEPRLASSAAACLEALQVCHGRGTRGVQRPDFRKRRGLPVASPLVRSRPKGWAAPNRSIPSFSSSSLSFFRGPGRGSCRRMRPPRLSA